MNYQSLKKRIKNNEGFSTTPYKDQLGNLTIGYGHLIKKNEKNFFSKKHNKIFLNKVFEKDFKEALGSFNKHFDRPKFKSKKTKELFIEMIFQMGIKKVLKFKKMINLIKNDNKNLAAVEMMNSLWYVQTPKRVENLINNFLHR